MNFFKSVTKGNRFQIIGYIVFFSCWIIPVILTEGFKVQCHIDIIVMLIQMGVGGFLILLGGTINKREKDDPHYVIPKNIFRVFKAWQILLMIAVVLYVALVFSNMYEVGGGLTIALTFVMHGCVITAAVLGIIQYRKNKNNYISVGGGKMIRANSHVNSAIRCNRCNKLLNPDDLRMFEGKKYCSSCYMKTLAEERAKEESVNEKLFHTHCSVCNRAFPQSAFHIVNDKYLCDDCFKKKFNVNLQ